MNKKVIDLLFSLAIMGGYDYSEYYINDPKVNNCLVNMYFYMMYNSDNKQKKEEYFKEFEKSYNDLNDEQQEIVKNDYISIIESQNKNKEKVKKKGMNDYE